MVPFRWVTCDESYGKSPAFLEEIEALNKWYLAEVPADTRVWRTTPSVEPPGPGLFGRPRIHPRVRRTAPAPQELRTMLAQVPAAQWHRRVIKEGSKGPLVAEFASLRVTPVREKLPGPRCWAIFRRTLGAKPEVKFYLSNAPSLCPQAELVRLSGMRWPVETVFEESKGEIGLDHYQLRTWRGWHHHMIQSFLAHLFLIRLRILFQKKSRPHDSPGAPVDCAGDRGRSGKPAQHSGYAPLSPRAKSCRLSFPSQAHTGSASQASAEAAKRQSLVFIGEVSYSYEVSL